MSALALAGGGPFDLADPSAYRQWRSRKLRACPERISDLLVEVADPARLDGAERAAILERCRRANMAVYASRTTREDGGLLVELGARLGLHRLDANWLAGEDGVSRIEVAAHGARGDFIPYTDRPIRWHTDGYYHPPGRRIRAMLLHCVRNAGEGGENALLDHEIAYIRLRDADPDYIRALLAPDAMTIPERADAAGVARPAESGPVFSVCPDSGRLHMRFTARTTSIEWKDDAATRAAVGCLLGLLDSDDPAVLRCKLQPGMGLVCNNVLHDRSGFRASGQAPRLLLRARFLDRVAG